MGAFIRNLPEGYTIISHPDPMYMGGASAVSDDGKTVIGFFRPWGSPATSGEGFIRTKETGSVNLNAYVASLGYDDGGITFALPLGISPDGKYIAGPGTTNSGLSGFVIKLPSNLATGGGGYYYKCQSTDECSSLQCSRAKSKIC